MSSERKFGPEIIIVDEGGATVRELKAATAFLVGTAPIHEVHETTSAQSAYINKKVLIRRREDIAKYFGPVRDGYTIPTALNLMFDQSGTQGLGTICVVNVFDPGVHKDGEDNPDPSQVDSLDIIGAFDAAGNPSGFKQAYACYQAFGWFPKILLAPGFSDLTGVRAEMAAIAAKIRGRYLLDAPLGVTMQQVIEARGPSGSFDWQLSDPRAIGCWPFLDAVNLDESSATAGQAVPYWYSPRLAGKWLWSVMEKGYHHSPSNRPIVCEGPSQEVLYIPGDFTSDVQELRGAGVITVEERWGKGPHTSGNRSLAYPTDTDMRNFVHVLYIEDVLHEAILHYLDEWKDRNANPASLEKVEDTINAWGSQKTVGKDPALSGFRFAFNREKTTVQNVAEGWLYWTLEWAPIGLMERLTVESWININMLGDPLGLATSSEPKAA